MFIVLRNERITLEIITSLSLRQPLTNYRKLLAGLYLIIEGTGLTLRLLVRPSLISSSLILFPLPLIVNIVEGAMSSSSASLVLPLAFLPSDLRGLLPSL
jgi:hypothetical protein